MKPTKTIVLCGTHQSPAIELYYQLQSDHKYSWKTYYIGRPYQSPTSKLPSTESHFSKQSSIPFLPINPGKFDRMNKLKSLLFIPHTLWSICKSYLYLQKINPDIIISTGGYASVPVIIAGWILSIPSINHEQTIITTLAANINSFFCTKIALSFDYPSQISSLPISKVVVTGNLLRSQLYKKTNYPKIFSNNKPILLVICGNQGSIQINSLILQIASKLYGQYNIFHLSGIQEFDKITKLTQKNRSQHYVASYWEADKLAPILQHASLIISRAGANSTQEIESLNKKAILIPLLSRKKEQTANALWAQNLHPEQIIILQESEANPESLLSAITKLSKVPDQPPTLVQPNKHKFLNLIHSLLLQTDL